MIKNIAIAVLSLMFISVAVFAFQKSNEAEKAQLKANELAQETEETLLKAEKMAKLAAEQAVSATQAMESAQEQLKKCREGK